VREKKAKWNEHSLAPSRGGISMRCRGKACLAPTIWQLKIYLMYLRFVIFNLYLREML